MPIFSTAPATDANISTTDITTNDATTSKHGWLLKLGGGTTNFLRADGTWAAAGSSQRLRNYWPGEYSDNTTAKCKSDLNLGGTVTIDGGCRMRTNTTGSAYAQVFYRRAGTGYGVAQTLDFDDSPELIAVIMLPTMTASWDGDIGIECGTNGGGPGSSMTLTQNHIAFGGDVVTGTLTLYSSNGNGSTQTRSDDTASITMGKPTFIRATMTGTTDIKFYADATLISTHTTNLPTGVVAGGVNNVMSWGQNDAGETSDYSWIINNLELSYAG